MLLLGAFGLCIAVLVVAPPINGARRWFLVGPISVQPSELAKIAVCIWACALLARRPAPRTLGELLKPLGIVVGLFCVLILLEPDLGTTIALCLMVGGILLVSDVPFRLLALAGSLALVLGAAAIYMEPYRRARFLSFIDPWQDPQGAGFQTVQAIIGMGSGGITGEGLGHGISKIFYLPEAHTDMIFAIVGEELGLIGSTVVIAAFAVFAWAGFRIALACRDPFGKRLAAGITTLVCAQAAINLCAVLGIAPLTGIPLPFVSYGGSSLIVLLAGVGVLLNIAVNERVVEARVVIAAGGTAGHVRPALAVAEALRARGATVTFAGVPTASSRGWFLKRASSSTRSRSAASRARRPSRSCERSGGPRKAPFACRAILAPATTRRRARRRWVRRRADGARRPAEPDPRRTHRGRRPPRPRQPAGGAVRRRSSSSPTTIDGRGGAKFEVVGRPIPIAHLGSRPGRSASALRPRRRRARRRRLRRARRRRARSTRWPSPRGATAARRAPRLRRAGLCRRSPRACTGPTTCWCRRPITSATCSPRPTSPSPGRVGPCGSWPPPGTPSILVPYPYATADHQTLNARHFERGGGAIVVPNDEIASVPALVDELLADPARLAAMREAMLAMARVDAADRIAEGLIALARR